MPVLLKGFDAHLKSADALIFQISHRLDLESASPQVWTKKQVEDLRLISLALFGLRNAIAEMANQVRDD